MKPLQFIAASMLCLVVIGALVVAGYSRSVANFAKSMALPEKTRAAGQPMPVRSEVVHKEEFTQVIGATAVTEASSVAIVRFPGPVDPTGQLPVLQSVAANEGAWVKQGDVLFEIDREMVELHEKQAEATVAKSEAELQGIKTLYERKAASQYELRDAELRMMTAKLDLEMTRRRLQASSVTAPISGQLDLVSVVAGETVAASQELTTVYQLDPIHVRVELPQERVAEVTKGAKAEIVIDSFPQDVFEGTVVSLSPQVDPDTRVLSAVVAAPNPDHRIKAGMSGFVRFQTVKTGLVAADSAIVELDGKASVFVVEDGHAKIRQVRTGPLVETGKRVVESGLADGDEVVVYGQQDLLHNDLVDTDWRKWTRREVSEAPAEVPAEEPAVEDESSDTASIVDPAEAAEPTLVTAAGQ